MTRPFNAKLSYRLDTAIVQAERGNLFYRLVKRFLEWRIFGGRL